MMSALGAGDAGDAMGMPDGRRTLPIFALNAVLFPGAPLPLHIFEQRYRAMVAACLEAEAPEFVVLLIREGDEVVESPVPGLLPGGRPPTTYQVGTVARIESHEHLPDGRYLLLCRGTRRVRLHAWTQQQPYPAGEFDPLPDHESETRQDTTPGLETPGLADRVREAVMTLLSTIAQSLPAEERDEWRQVQQLLADVPQDDTALSYFVPRVLFGASAVQKQRLLECPSTAERLRVELPLVTLEAGLALRLKPDPDSLGPSAN